MVRACALVSIAKDTTGDHVEAERALIIWDEPHHIEHFIRQASFHAMQSQVGFLVPTPETPEIAEVDPAIFDIVNSVGGHDLIAPIVYHTPWEAIPPILLGIFGDGGRSPYVPMYMKASARWNIDPDKQNSGGSNSQEETAKYRATTVDPADLAAVNAVISSWSNEKNVPLSAPVMDWLKIYAGKGWKITAFHFDQASDAWPANRVTSPAIRLSFHTDKPFYPYCEPMDRQNPDKASPFGRALRVAILSDHRMTAQLADNNPWPGQLKFAGPSLPNESSPSGKINSALPTVDQVTFPNVASGSLTLNPQAVWSAHDWLIWAGLDDPKRNLVLPPELTSFVDNADPRPGTADLYFTADANSGPFRGQETDDTKAWKNRMDFSHPLLDLATCLVLILLPAAPLYCGWHVLRRRRIEARHPTASAVVQPTPRPGWIRVLLGMSAILLGIWYGGQLLFILVGGLTSIIVAMVQGEWNLSGFELALIPVALLFSIAFLFVFWSGIYCGVRVIRQRPFSEITRQRWKLLCAEGRWSGYMGVSCVFIGTIALVVALTVATSMAMNQI